MKKPATKTAYSAPVFALTITAYIIVAFSTLLPAQSWQPDVEEVLRWFPLGEYDLIVHEETLDLEEAETYPLYRAFFEPYDNRTELLFDLPPALKHDILSRTMAQLLQVRAEVYANPEEAKNFQPVYGDLVASEQVGDHVYIFESAGERLTVYRYLFLESLIKEAIAKNQIDDTGLRIERKPVYSFIADRQGEFVTFYIYATMAQELLVAEKPAQLRRMVMAGRGSILGLIDGEEYRQLPLLSDQLGQAWRFRSYAAIYRAMIEYMSIAREPPEKIAELERRMNEEETYWLDSRELDDRIIFRDVHHFGDYLRAQKWLDRTALFQDVGIMTAELLSNNLLLFYQYRKFERQGQLVISVVTYEDTHIESLWDELERVQERAERARAEEEANGDEGG